MSSPDRRTTSRRAAVVLAVVAAALFAAGCASKGPKPSVFKLSAVAGAQLNPDGSGRPSPLVVRVYALRARTEFDKADFFALYEKDEQILAADLVKRDELILKPGETVKLPREFAPDVQYVAVLAAFRDVQQATWRAAVKIKPGSKGGLLLTADDKSVSLVVED